MVPEISEFSYGYALISELIALFGLKSAGAPEFSTQYAEGKKGGGWDVKLPVIPIYIQIKRSDIMVRRTASESSKFANFPFYRFHIHRRNLSAQHQLLLDLETARNVVLYAAPGFSKSNELHKCYVNDEVIKHSIFIKPSSIGPLKDDKNHCVSFQTNPSLAYFCSEPRKIETTSPNVFFRKQLVEIDSSLNRNIDGRFLYKIGDEMLSVYLRRHASNQDAIGVEKIRRMKDRREPADYVQLISRTLFSCELLFYRKDNNKSE